MLCQRCHKNLATVRYTEVVDGRTSALSMCSDCLQSFREEVPSGFELSEPVVSMASADDVIRDAMISARQCRVCGTKLQQLAELGIVGCAACYECFGEQIAGILTRDYGTVPEHTGKNPNVDAERQRRLSELQAKRGLLRMTVLAEHYEEAASLRDEIKALERELGYEEQR